MAETLVVEGGRPLRGTIRVSGAKNAALPLLVAPLLSDGRCVLQNVPDLKDIRTLTEILDEVGMTIDQRAPGTLVTEVVSEDSSTARYELVSQMRASIYLLGPLLAKRGHAKISLPGGCVIGLRPVDLHIKGMRALGATIRLEHGYIIADAPEGGRLRGAQVSLRGPMGSSVGATCNTLMAACLADGETIIDDAAYEPEIGELARFLIRMGAIIKGIDTPQLVITGVPALGGANCVVPPDRIEAATYMIAAAATGGDVRLEDMRLDHLDTVTDKLREAGVTIEEEDDGTVRVTRVGPLKPINMTTLTYPGFPTDIQAQLVSLMAITPGSSVVTETIYPDRFMHLAELNRMGANMTQDGASAIITGVETLTGADVMASDLRAGAALVIAGLVAKGTTIVHRIYHIDRGYESIENKLTSLGATIRRVSQSTATVKISRAA
jgi:UDP-N-acetylglucosamine 1-carboxyvinyltransferase